MQKNFNPNAYKNIQSTVKERAYHKIQQYSDQN